MTIDEDDKLSNQEFLNMTDDQVIDYIVSKNPPIDKTMVRKLADGEWIMLYPLMFTLSVCCGVGKINQFKYRWCFENPEEAIYFFNTCENFDDIPTKRESLKGHRYLKTPRLVEYDELGYPKW